MKLASPQPTFKWIRANPHARPGTGNRRPHHERCQVATPTDVVQLVWTLLGARRTQIGSVLDLGAGDGRFALHGKFEKYVGFENDLRKRRHKDLPASATIRRACALDSVGEYDTAIGNPPFGRNQDIAMSWRSRMHKILRDEAGEQSHGLENLYLYFMWLSILRTRSDGIVALVVPFEWVSRPSGRRLRSFIERNGWKVEVVRLNRSKEHFPRVKTTASVTIIDKFARSSQFHYYEADDLQTIRPMAGPAGKAGNLLPHDTKRGDLFARRGFSPGSQHIFTLTETERKEAGIRRVDVAPCITSLRETPQTVRVLDTAAFNKHYRNNDEKCWLLKTDKKPLDSALRRWLNAAPEAVKKNSTCSLRPVWYEYPTPSAPRILYSAGFRAKQPKMVANEVGAVNVGAIHGIFGPSDIAYDDLLAYLRNLDYGASIVPQAHGLKKIEVRQMNGVLNEYSKGADR